MKTKDINRDDYWMGTAFMVAANSEIQQGCVFVNSHSQEIMSIASATILKGVKDKHFTHPEMTALLNCKMPSNATVILTHTPCYQCILSLLGASVRRIVYYETDAIDPLCEDAAQSAFVPIEKFTGNLNWMRDYIKSLDIF